MNKTIMIIDDSATLRHMVNVTLTKAGYTVVQAKDGVDALQKLPDQVPDIILCDLNMPNMDGLEFVREVKKIKQYMFIPILMLTTESQSSKKEEGKKAGARAWIVKPFKPERIIAAVEKLIR